MGSRMGMYPPPPSSGLWSESQMNHWPFVLHVNKREDLGAVHPSKLLAGSLGAIGMGCISPSLSRTVIMSTGLAQWFHMDPDANFTIAGSRRSQVAWVILIYLIGFHVIPKLLSKLELVYQQWVSTPSAGLYLTSTQARDQSPSIDAL